MDDLLDDLLVEAVAVGAEPLTHILFIGPLVLT